MRSPSAAAVEGSSSALFPVVGSGSPPESGGLAEGLRMNQVFAHRPVMVAEVVELLGSSPPGVVVDATVGGGGHAEALLEVDAGRSLVGLDRDGEALTAAARRLGRFGRRVALHHARFADLVELVPQWRAAGPPSWPEPGAVVTGLLLDLGVSSPQLDRPERGFSYHRSGPLDMRMDLEARLTASEVVNSAPADELAALFAANGEGRLARRLARAVVAARPLTTTTQLAEVIADAVPAPGRRRGHPARRVFQALRIAVNDELDQLAAVLPDALELLAPGGRAVVISYHSGEDRLVKQALLRAERGRCTCPPGMPCVCGAPRRFRLTFRGARRPTAAEVAENHRAESARLRAIDRLAEPAAATAVAAHEGRS
jgi:16S rRNA (cytosine1402-N4)-methyltransferase